MENEYRMSAEKKQELEVELNYLKTTRSDEVAEQIKIARGFGDLSENSEYDEAKIEQGKLYSKIAELEEMIQHAVIVDIRCKVTVKGPNGREMTYSIVGSQESDPMHGIISEESPFGKAVLRFKEVPGEMPPKWISAQAGDVITVEAPQGNMQYTVVRIEM
ncbi:MAG: transcription elongation factor GreA [Oscillibacter sp.]|nr:transcription elongation factor GreA [Oscillibacter sp.]